MGSWRMKGKIRTGSSLHPTHIPFARKLTHRPARKGIIRPGEWTVRSGPVISFHSLRSLIHSFPSTRSHPSLHSLTSLSLLSMSWWPKGMLGRTWRDRATLHSPTHRSSRIERWGGGLRKSGEKRRKDSEWEVRLGRSFLLPFTLPFLVFRYLFSFYFHCLFSLSPLYSPSLSETNEGRGGT